MSSPFRARWSWRRFQHFALALILGGMLAVPASAADHMAAKAEQAKALAEKAAAWLATHEPAQAFGVFSDGKGPFVKDGLYVFAINKEGTIVAHGAQPIMIGRSVHDLQDPTGKLFGREIMAVQDRGFVEYQWMNPQTHAFGHKKSYIIRVKDYWVGAGIYVP